MMGAESGHSDAAFHLSGPPDCSGRITIEIPGDDAFDI